MRERGAGVASECVLKVGDGRGFVIAKTAAVTTLGQTAESGTLLGETV